MKKKKANVILHCTQPVGFLHFLEGCTFSINSMTENISSFENVAFFFF